MSNGEKTTVVPTRRYEDYIGDGAYVYLDRLDNVILYTSNGIEETNTVCLEPFVLRHFEEWLKRVRNESE